ncbi:MAG: MFS transporter [Fibrobacteres bacterium]|nr:MFS transporter [Fibrobacterota bacterium]
MADTPTTDSGYCYDKKQLNGDRIRMGLGTILHQSEESGIGPIPTVIVKTLGGDDRHLGFMGALGGLTGIGAVFANVFLKWKKSNRNAMSISMLIGAIIAASIGVILLQGYHPERFPIILKLYLPLLLIFSLVCGMQNGIEANWVGDLVPEKMRGWFMKIKWVLSIIGTLVFSIVFARFSDAFPTFGGYATIYFVFSISFLVASFIVYSKVTDRVPATLNYVSAGASHKDRVNYKEKILWYMIGWSITFSGGRGILGAFTAVYLLDYFHYSLTKIAMLTSIQTIMSMLVVYIIGDHTDRWGPRRPLIIAQFIVGLSMFLWVGSAFWGVKCIIIYMVLNGVAGHTLSFLGGNFILEVYPKKGRAAYMGAMRMIANPTIFILVAISGWLAHAFNGFEVTIFGTLLNRYHLIFTFATLFTLSCQIFLFLIGSKRIQSIEEKGE